MAQEKYYDDHGNPYQLAVTSQILGSACFEKKHYDDARVFFEIALEAAEKVGGMESFIANVHHNIAASYYSMAQYKKADEASDKALAIETGNSVFYRQAILTNIRLSKHEKVIELCERAIPITTNDSQKEDFYIKKGLAQNKLGLDNDALSSFNEALKINPESRALEYKAFALSSLGRHQQEYDTLGILIENYKAAGKDVRSWYYMKGEAAEKLGKYNEASVCYERSGKGSGKGKEPA